MHLFSRFILILLLFSCTVVYARDNYSFRHLDTEKGLSQNAVLCILQDKVGFMWFGTKDGLNRYDGNQIRAFKHDEQDPYSIGNNTIWSLLECPNGDIWVGTEKGVFIYNPISERFTLFDKKTSTSETINHWVTSMKMDKEGNIWIAAGRLFCYSLTTDELYINTPLTQENPYPQIWDIEIDNNDVWVGTSKAGLLKYSIKDHRLESPTIHYTTDKIQSCITSKIINYSGGHLLAGSFNKGLMTVDKKTGIATNYNLNIEADESLYIREVKSFSDGNIWIGTQSGLYIHDPITKKTTYLYHNLNDRHSLSDNTVYSMYEDREGGIWIGTYFGGVCYYPKELQLFKKDYPISNENSIIGERISGMCEDQDGNIWIGTEDAGLCMLNKKTKRFEYYRSDITGEGLSYQNVHDLVMDGQQLWIATFSDGINIFDTHTKKWKYHKKGDKKGSIDNNDIFALFKDSKENIWVGTSSSAFGYNRELDEFEKINDLNYHFISDIIEDPKGNIWFSTYDNGVYKMDCETKEFTSFAPVENDTTSICHYKITCMFVDSQGNLWFASESRGICMYDADSNNFIRYGSKDGFVNNVIYKILEDDNQNLWLSSNAGIMQFNPKTKKIKSYTLNSGLPSNQFNYKSGFKDKKGNLYFGSVKGMISFNPAKISQNEYIPSVVITEFRAVDDKKRSVNHIVDGSPIVLEHNQSSISINFAALSFLAPEMNEFSYILEGFDNAWTHIQQAKEVTYSNLPHGNYTFRLKGSNNEGVWNEKEEVLEITIRPPLWLTSWAYLLYFLTFFIITFYFFYLYKHRIEKKNRIQNTIFRNEKEKEIYNAKIDFFTNIAHEIRTPLTLIKGPLEHILTTEVEKDEVRENLKTMDKNVDRLLTLINQLLDFRKTESQSFSLSFVNTNINEIIKNVYVRFKPLAIQKNIQFNLTLTEDIINADVDKEALTKIISNLFTNALKYADSTICINLSSPNDQHFEMRVSNDGDTIDESYKEKIFEPFFQIKNAKKEMNSGSGIGLALVKSLVELHNGKIELDISGANTFIVTLPNKQQEAIVFDEKLEEDKSIKREISALDENNNENENKKFSILVIEDNDELLNFIIDKLHKQYHVYKANNGQEALEILYEHHINIILSDIMMPVMDGFELLQRLKEDVEYSHIPFILLTAKTNVQSKIEGLELGADAYIEKPFSVNYLLAQIENLLDSRKRIREAYINSPFLHVNDMALNKADEEFLNKLSEAINNNIDNIHFNVELLAELMHMSRSSLLRKVKGVSEITPNEIIKLTRLKKAAEILQAGKYKVNEVCYLVGFSSPSYFSKEFHKQFGVLPKDFIKSVEDKSVLNSKSAD